MARAASSRCACASIRPRRRPTTSTGASCCSCCASWSRPIRLHRAPDMLRSSTDPAWFARSTRDLEGLLSDHLHCERKAAENALHLVRRYPGDNALVEQLARLAHEETSHLVQMAALLEERGLQLRPDTPNHYTRGLLAQVASREPERKMD